MHIHELYDIASGVVVGSSALYSFLPSYEIFADFPRTQKVYKVFTLVILKFGSVNFRSMMNPAIRSVENASGTVTPQPLPDDKK
jgi:hypothetical protein